MKVRNRDLWAVLFLSFLSACASPGPPQPPALELAEPVSDLHAVRKGDAVTLSWTNPTKTTDGRNITRWGKIQICRSTDPENPCSAVVKRIPHTRQTAASQSYTDQLAPDLTPPSAHASYFYAIRVLNSYGKTAGLSNHVDVPLAPTLPAPTNLKADLSADGVTLSWDPVEIPANSQGLSFSYRIYRRDNTARSAEVAGELPVVPEQRPTFTDRSFLWEHTYSYYVTVVTTISEPGGSKRQVEGDDTPPVTVFAHDTFPPATPSGLQAVFSGPGQKPFIDLVWNANNDADFAGYNVYRHEKGSAPEKLNSELIKSPAFRDPDVEPGRQYFYSVSAVDLRGNESPRSEEANEAVP